MELKTTRCTACRAEFAEAELEGAVACPSCGTHGVPCAISEDVVVAINWHELRILGIWADNWARQYCDEDSVRLVGTILRAVHKQFPDKAPLTMGEELQELADSMGSKVEVHDSSGVKTLSPKPKN